MTSTKEIKQLQKAKSKAQSSNNLKEEASLCNQLGEVYAKTGDYHSAIEEHRQELKLSEILHDVIGSAVANRKIGECYAELGNIKAALKHQRLHLNLARSVHDAAEEQRALATIGRTYLFLFDSDNSRDSLKHAEDAFKKSLAIVDERLEGTVSPRELSEMKARLLLNLGCVYDGMKEPQRCSDFIRQSIYIAEKNNLLEDLYRANFNLGSIHFRNGQHSRAMRCFEQSKECARKMKDKFSESECFHSIGKVLLYLGDFAAARRSLKKAFCLGSQQPSDREAVKRDFKHAIRGCQLEQMATEVTDKFSHEAMDLSEQLGDLYCKVGCYNKALEAYQAQLVCAEVLGKPALYVSDLLSVCEEETGQPMETLDQSFSAALSCAERSGLNKLQRRVLRAWLQAQRRCGSSQCDHTEARLMELCERDGLRLEDSEEEDEEEEVENSEPLEDSDIQYSDSDEDLEGYDKTVTGRRKTKRWNRRNEKGETVLHRACIEGNLKQVQYLLDQGHPVNLRDYCGWTALHEACNYGHQEIVALLLDRGANISDPGGRDCEGVTPLHDTLNCGHFHVARLLVERGASVTVRNGKGHTPLDTLRQWFKTYSRQLDQETKQECLETEKLIKRALSGDVSVVSALPRQQKELQDSQLFDAECSEPLLQESRPAFVSLFLIAVQSSSSRGLSLKKGTNKPRQVKMNQMPGMVNLGRREVSRSQSPIMTQESEPIHEHAPPTHQSMPPASFQNRTAHVPAPIRMRVRVQDNVFLIPVPHSEADSCTVAWLCDQAAQRYYQTCGLLPRLSLQKEGALLLPTDPLLAVLHTNEEVVAEVCSWDLPPLPERYRKACQSLTVEENRRVSRLCEVQDSSSCVNVCGLSLPPAALTPLLRALKLQASLTELRISANRLNNDLLPELMSAAATMPRLRILDISANQITGEGLRKALDTFETKSQAAFPCLEELNLSMNPLGDGWTQALVSLLSACPMLSALSLQACGLSARFLQQHRLLLANALASTGNMRSVCLSHNALGSTGFELVLKTLPMHCLTHLQLSAVCRGPSDQPAMEILTKLLTQGDCALTHLNLAGNGLTDHSVLLLARCLPVCPSLVSLDLSANPSVTSVGLQSLLNALMEAQRPLTHLNLQGCQVSGPLGDVCLDNLSDHIRDLRLCSQSLNKLDQDALQQTWRRRSEHVHVFSRNSKCMLSITAASQ
uniref:Tonsoku-like protein n=1 Tax=Cyprinus carpio TaxID=7962 RepID=A0A8C1S972_CYPCA